MAVAAKSYGAPSAEKTKVIKVFMSGKLAAKVEFYADVFDAALAQDITDFNVHISATLTELTDGTLTTIS